MANAEPECWTDAEKRCPTSIKTLGYGVGPFRDATYINTRAAQANVSVPSSVTDEFLCGTYLIKPIRKQAWLDYKQFIDDLRAAEGAAAFNWRNTETDPAGMLTFRADMGAALERWRYLQVGVNSNKYTRKEGVSDTETESTEEPTQDQWDEAKAAMEGCTAVWYSTASGARIFHGWDRGEEWWKYFMLLERGYSSVVTTGSGWPTTPCSPAVLLKWVYTYYNSPPTSFNIELYHSTGATPDYEATTHFLCSYSSAELLNGGDPVYFTVGLPDWDSGSTNWLMCRFDFDDTTESNGSLALDKTHPLGPAVGMNPIYLYQYVDDVADI